MAAFEFFFSFYGLLLGLSVAVIATGMATAIQHRHKIRIGWLTPLLALFVGMDIASFWDSAWVNFRDLPFSYGMLVIGLAITLVYFIAASLVFPHAIEDGASLDDHFWANKRVVLMLTVVANTMVVLAAIVVNLGKPGGMVMIVGYLLNLAFYMALIIPAALARRSPLFAAMIGLHMYPAGGRLPRRAGRHGGRPADATDGDRVALTGRRPPPLETRPRMAEEP